MARHSRLSDRIESVQKRALKNIYHNSSYSQALSIANETTLSNRREHICHKFMAETTDVGDYPLSCLVSNKKLIVKTLDLALLDHSIISRELRDQRTFLLSNIRHLRIRHDHHFKGFFKYM